MLGPVDGAEVPARCPSATAWRAHLDNLPARPGGPYWGLRLFPAMDLFIRPLHAFGVIALGSCRVVHVGVIRHPTVTWVAQQLREATPFGQRPRYLIRDHNSKDGQSFMRVSEARRTRGARCGSTSRTSIPRGHNQGLQQRIPAATQVGALRPATAGTVPAVAVLGGLHYLNRRVCPDPWRETA